MQLLMFCSVCEVRGVDPGNPYGNCAECAEDMEIMADLLAEVSEKRAANCSDTSIDYEGEVMGVPGSRHHRALQGFIRWVADE